MLNNASGLDAGIRRGGCCLGPAHDLVTSSLWKLAASNLTSLIPGPAVFASVGQLVERAVHGTREHGKLGIACVFGGCEIVRGVAETASRQYHPLMPVRRDLLSHDLIAIQPR